MNTKEVADAYRQGSVENAPPIKIVRMLYQGAIRYLGQAMETDPQDAFFGDRVVHVDQIVTELRLALAPEVDSDLCEKLEGLYLFVESSLLQAMTDHSAEPLGPARSVLETLLGAWSQVELETA